MRTEISGPRISFGASLSRIASNPQNHLKEINMTNRNKLTARELKVIDRLSIELSTQEGPTRIQLRNGDSLAVYLDHETYADEGRSCYSYQRFDSDGGHIAFGCDYKTWWEAFESGRLGARVELNQ